MDYSTKEVIEKIFQVLFNDLASEMSEVEAGWRFPYEMGIDPIIQKQLLESRIIKENSEGKIRINSTNYRIPQELKRKFPLHCNQLEYFLNVKKDEIKVIKAQEAFDQIIKIIQQSPSTWTYIVALGWWRMLESSGLPVLIDDVLNEGFSPGDWTIKAVKSSPELALGVSQILGEINDFKNAINFVRQLKIPINEITLPSSVDQDEVKKVKKILKWNDIEKELIEPVIKTLAFWWFAFLVLESDNLFPNSNESIVKLYKMMWEAIEILLGESKQKLISKLENMMSTFDSNDITWASDIFRIPEVI